MRLYTRFVSLVSLLAVAFLVFASRADASLIPVDSVCQVYYSPDTKFGVDGGLGITWVEAGACTSEQPRRQGMFCSASSTDASCTTVTKYRYKLAALMMLFDFLNDVRITEERVSVKSGACSNGSEYCLWSVASRETKP